MSVKKYFNLTVYCDGSVDERTLEAFEEAFQENKPTSSFVNQDDHGEVVLRNHKLVGYKKSELTESACKVLEAIDT